MAPDFTVSVKQAEMKRERERERKRWMDRWVCFQDWASKMQPKYHGKPFLIVGHFFEASSCNCR
jgi:hypothetical protein